MDRDVKRLIEDGMQSDMPNTPGELHGMRVRLGLTHGDIAALLDAKTAFIESQEAHTSYVFREDYAALLAGFDVAAQDASHGIRIDRPLVVFHTDADFEMVFGRAAGIGNIRLARLIYNEAMRRRHYDAIWDQEGRPQLTWFDRRTWNGGDLHQWAADHMTIFKRRPA